MSALQLQALAGLAALCLLAWTLGGCRRGVRLRVVVAGLLGQMLVAAALLHLPPLRAGFAWVGDAVDALARATRAGTTLVFGYLGGGPLPYAETVPGGSFILFFQALPLVLLVGALSAVLYHWRIMPLVVRGLARGLGWLFGLSGACNLSVAANVFVGMVEAPLLIRPWLGRLTEAELFVVMVAGLATISGNMLVVYATMIAPVVPDAAGQLLTASLVSAPGSILAALLMLPEREVAALAAPEGEAPRLYDSTMDALVRGTADGLQLLLGIMASLVVFVALVALANGILQPLTGWTLEGIAGWVFWPLAFAMGIPASECATVGASLGVKVVVNEFVSYLQLAASGGAGLAPRSRVILTYALCGFTNFASVGIMVTGMAGMCPERRADILRLGLKALVAASIACCMAGATVGVLTAP
ncbi:MAG: Nucleoside permease NupC [uncultured Craurococcus sp.]|uniref:Nucleoside permease NupC n=1 Tax=uncultured Craurococcus sp. TaxID=1135998 RepID=A0A6J4JX10_9PROT|nr:MAG: Nucleoside permease NupC [uncultured Craurococcus sp.]